MNNKSAQQLEGVIISYTPQLLIEELKMGLASFIRLDPVNNTRCYLGRITLIYLYASPPEHLDLLY